jgi:hypothetical protein
MNGPIAGFAIAPVYHTYMKKRVKLIAALT